LRYGGTTFDTATSGKLKLVVEGGDGNHLATWNSAVPGGTWNETEANWKIASTSYEVFKKGDSVKFTDTGAGTIAVTEGMSVSTMIVDNSAGNDYTFTGNPITSTAAFTKSGDGSLTFSGANAFASATLNGGRTDLLHSESLGTGSITLSSGTMGLANGLNMDNALNMGGAASLAVEGGDAATLSGNFSGNGSLNKTGSGRLTLSNGAAFTGTMNVNDGTLALASGQTIRVTEFNLAADKRLDVANTTSVVTTGNINFAKDSILALDMTGAANTGTVLALNATGTLDFGASGTVIVDAINIAGLNGSYTVISADGVNFAGKYEGRIDGQASSFGGANVRYGGADYDAGQLGKLLLHVTGVDGNRQATWTGANGNTWNETEENWDLEDSSYHVFKKGDAVVFGSAGSGIIAVASDMSVSTMEVTGGTYTFTNNGMTSTGAFTNSGGNVTFDVANSFASALLAGGTTTLNNTGALGSGSVSMNGGTLGLADMLDFTNNVSLSGSGSVSVAGGESATMSGVVSGGGSFTKTGAGTLALSGANTYAGGTTVLQGKLVGNATSLQGDVINNAALSFDQTANEEYTGNVTGTGSFEKTGTGNLTLAGNVSQGSVVLNEGALTVAAGKSVKTTGLFNVNDGTALGVTVGASPAVDAGSFNVGTGATLNISGYTSEYPQTVFTLVKSGADISGSFATVKVGGQTVVPETPDIDVFLEVQVDQQAAGGKEIQIGTDLVWNKSTNAHGTFNIADGQSFTLDADLSDNEVLGAGTTFGWDGKSLTKEGDGSLILTGDNSYTGGTTVSGGTLVGDTDSLQGNIVNNAAVSFNQAGDGTYSGDMSGTGSLSKEGAGDLILAGTNNYSGGTTVSGGTLIGDTNSLQGDIVNNAAVKFDEAGDGTYSGDMSGAGSLTKEGAGDLTLTGTNNYAGGTTVSGGTLIGDTGSLQGDIENNAAVKFDEAGDGTYSGDMSGTGSLTKEGAGDLTLAGTNNYAGGTTVSGGTLIGDTDSLQGDIVNNAAVKFDEAGDGMYSGDMSGAGSLTKEGAGDLTLAGANSYSGGTTVSDGTLIGDTNSLQGDIENNAAVSFNQAGDGTYSGDMSGTGSLTKEGAGDLILSGANNYTGGTTVSGGTLVGDTNSLQGNIVNNAAVNFDQAGDGTYSGNMSGTGSMTKSDAGDLILTGTNSHTGGTTISGGTLQIGDGGTKGSITGDIENNSALVFNRSDDVTYADTISGTGSVAQDGSGNLILTEDNTYTGGTTISDGILTAGNKDALGTGDVTTNGNGVLVLDFAGEFENNITGSGNVEIAGDGVVINKSANVAMSVTGTLAGSSSHKSLAVKSGGTLSPGDGGFGTITTGSLTFDSGSTYEVEVEPGGTNSDLLRVTGTASLAGTVHHIGFPESGSTYSPIGEWTILTADTLIGEFDAVIAGYKFLDASLLYGANEVKLQLVRNAFDFASQATTPNQKAVAEGIESQGTGSEPYDYVAGQFNSADMGPIYDGFSGEMHAGLPGEILKMDRYFTDQMLGRLGSAVAGTSGVSGVASGALTENTEFWISVDGYRNTADRTSNTSKSEFKGWGASLGVEKEVSDWTFGAAFRYGDSEYEVNNLHSKADLDSFNFGLYAGRSICDFNVKFGAGYGFHQADSRRYLVSTGENLKADYDMHSFQLFGELGYLKEFGNFSFEPYAGLAWNYVENESFTEKGGTSALRAKSESNDNVTSSLGVRTHYKPLEKIEIGADLNWQHLFGDKEPEARFAFTGGNSFTIEGAPMDRDSLGLGLDMDVTVRENLSIRAGYVGRFGEDTDSHAGFVSLEFTF
ncbi:autotransporter-associated beta strand repeat-containing protein, partial [Desulfococcaceae bacterium OttesenSCG-928-F15]|nr:autotransporter-associated beta strand repeat-containing protein [Desulfococcaceae bacterium OttesenSCG-928-F15]